MRNRSMLAILVIGILGMLAFGFITKFALDSNPSLIRIGKLKRAIAEDFSSQGLKEISVRSMPRKRGFEVRIETPRASHSDLDALAREIAESFIKKYAGPAPGFLKLSFLEPAGFGCRGPEEYYGKEFSVVALKAEITLRNAVKRLEDSLPPQSGYRILSFQLKNPMRLKVEVPPPKDPEDLEESISLLRAKARKYLSAGVGRVVVLEVWAGGPKPRLLKEETMGKPRRTGRRT